ncbi:hypothetical protein C5C24_04960 [Rathayibacter sp. AY2B3]|nr:hypothetical protein C5C24_04960 [Rathayibacter sp. AY2B3]
MKLLRFPYAEVDQLDRLKAEDDRNLGGHLDRESTRRFGDDLEQAKCRVGCVLGIPIGAGEVSAKDGRRMLDPALFDRSTIDDEKNVSAGSKQMSSTILTRTRGAATRNRGRATQVTVFPLLVWWIRGDSNP